MNLILARHGNTFHAHDMAYYVGSQHDLPLVAAGITQATSIGLALQRQKSPITQVYSGPLQRMQSTAQHALAAMHSDLLIQVDARLNEIDYGLWNGLTSQAVRQKFGEADYQAWERQSRWPISGEWGESEQIVINRISSFANELVEKYSSQDRILVVASNGCLRYFLKLVTGAFEAKLSQGQIKISTGHFGHLQYKKNHWTLVAWNTNPEDF